jgi:hypothetical protein
MHHVSFLVRRFGCWVPGMTAALTMREKMAPLYRRNAAAVAARKNGEQARSSAFSSQSFYVRAESTFPQPRERA